VTARECEEPGCPQIIEWAQSATSKSRMPVDADSADKPGGTLAVWVAGGELVYRNLKAGEEPSPGQHRGTSHYRTCTNPGRFSGKGKAASKPPAKPPEPAAEWCGHTGQYRVDVHMCGARGQSDQLLACTECGQQIMASDLRELKARKTNPKGSPDGSETAFETPGE
jgi:hypothetical protein